MDFDCLWLSSCIMSNKVYNKLCTWSAAAVRLEVLAVMEGNNFFMDWSDFDFEQNDLELIDHGTKRLDAMPI